MKNIFFIKDIFYNVQFKILFRNFYIFKVIYDIVVFRYIFTEENFYNAIWNLISFFLNLLFLFFRYNCPVVTRRI